MAVLRYINFKYNTYMYYYIITMLSITTYYITTQEVGYHLVVLIRGLWYALLSPGISLELHS